MLRRRRLATLGAACAGLLATTCLAASPTAAVTRSDDGGDRAAVTAVTSAAADATRTYTNYVTRGYSIDFPDPAVMRGKDGNWYAYSTGGPFDETGQTSSSYKIAKSADLVHWEDAGPVFPAGRRPAYATATTGFWAPDIRYLNGTYLLYFTVPDTTFTSQGFDPAIGVAAAPTPAGPWTAREEPLIPPRPNGGGWDTTIDPAMFTDTDGTHYMYWGGYGTGLWVVELSADGLRTTSEPRHIASSRFEGPNVLHRDGWYYLFGSSANCCAGPTTGYTVFVGRSRSPLGPFTDKLGVDLLASRSGGTPVIAPNGNLWIGTGHHSAAVDLSGETYMAYHAIDRNDPWLDVSPGFTMRPMNLDRMDWIDGWPIVRAGRGASDGPQLAPVVQGEVDDRFDDARATRRNFRTTSGKLSVAGPDDRSDSGGYASLAAGTVALTKPRAANVRVEADVRSAPDGVVGVLARGDVRALIDARQQELRVEAGRLKSTAKLPVGFDYGAWHVLALEARGGTITANVTDARLGDPWAEVSLRVHAAHGGPAGLVGTGEADNFSANRLYRPVTRAVPDPQPGQVDPALSDEFDGALESGWTWLRQDDQANVAGGQLEWPTQQADIVGDGTPGILFRDGLPDGDFTVETKLTLDIGTDVVRNFQQGGLIVHVNDDDFLRYDVVAVGPTRITEFGKETVFRGRRSWGGGVVGAPGETTWLRLVHKRDPETGEHLYRAGSSTDGERWTWGLTWTLPAAAQPRIGLVSHGSTPQTHAEYGPALSQFDYFHVLK